MERVLAEQNITLELVASLPHQLADGVLYVSRAAGKAIHRCPCRCGAASITSIAAAGWEFTQVDNVPSLSPSILNQPCGAHYFIRDGKVVWA